MENCRTESYFSECLVSQCFLTRYSVTKVGELCELFLLHFSTEEGLDTKVIWAFILPCDLAWYKRWQLLSKVCPRGGT